MAKVSFYGTSDDLVEVEGIEGADEFSTDGHWTGVLTAPDGGTALVYVDYRDNGCWTVTLGRYEEDYALPQWEMEVTSKDEMSTYSTYVELTVPDGTIIREHS